MKKKLYKYYSRHLRAYIRILVCGESDVSKLVAKDIKKCGTLDIPKTAGLSFCLTDDDSGVTYYYIRLENNWQPNAEGISVLAHEAVHTACDILKDRGINADAKGSSESLAYTVGEIVDAFLTAYYDAFEKYMFPGIKK